jgi:hypothetical protein
VVRQDGEAVLGKRRAQDVAQKAGAGVVVDRTRVGLGVQVETAVSHHEVTDDLGSSTCSEKHGLALAFGRARRWQTGNRRGRQLRQHRVAGRERLVYLQRFGADPDHASALQRPQDPHLRDLNHVCHLVGLQVAKRSEDRLGLIALITTEDIAKRILTAMHLPATVPALHPARPPPKEPGGGDDGAN